MTPHPVKLHLELYLVCLLVITIDSRSLNIDNILLPLFFFIYINELVFSLTFGTEVISWLHKLQKKLRNDMQVALFKAQTISSFD